MKIISTICFLAWSTITLGAEGSATIVIENAIVDARDGTDDELVNLIVKDGKLVLITRDGLPDEPDVRSFDAKGGVVLGKLDIRKPANFLILNEDPRENIEVLLNTGTHAVFAIVDGEVERNRLLQVNKSESSSRPSGWFSYSPPPFALPVDYAMSDRWNHFDIGKSRHYFTSALMVDRTRWRSQSTSNILQVGNLEDFDSADVRGFRFGMFGGWDLWGKPWTYTISGATNAFSKGFDTRKTNDFGWFDLRVDVPLFNETTLSIGKQKEPQGFERATGMVFLPFQERSMASDAFMPSRNTGIVLSGNINKRMTWAGGVFNDWLDSGGSRSDSATQYIGRITGLPLVTKDQSNLLHIGFGYRHSNTKEGFTTGTTPEVDSAPEFVDTGDLFPADRMITMNYELGWRKGPFWLMSEYTSAEIEDTPYGHLRLDGYYVAASWILTKEMRPYNHKSGTLQPVPVSNPVNTGGWGAWELAARYSTIDLTDKSLIGGEADVYTIGLNWWMQSSMLFTVSLQHAELDKPPLNGGPIITGDATGIISRLLLILE